MHWAPLPPTLFFFKLRIILGIEDSVVNKMDGSYCSGGTYIQMGLKKYTRPIKTYVVCEIVRSTGEMKNGSRDMPDQRGWQF